MSESIVQVTDSSFDQDVLQSESPVLVDFWASWCGPCKMIAPIVEQVATEYDGKLKVCKLDVDANPETAAKYGIRGIPALVMFNDGAQMTKDKEGAEVQPKVGALSKTQLSEYIDKLI
ncbi:MAG: thioredoxin TrxA [Gammaproteobacteria bacterium]|nr:thioredoxin TrxA [Gammaproteobacteria bacterium]MCY4358914.1 thioredoxin TrxA [Gammaproteobacteria bacterium]